MGAWGHCFQSNDSIQDLIGDIKESSEEKLDYELKILYNTALHEYKQWSEWLESEYDPEDGDQASMDLDHITNFLGLVDYALTEYTPLLSKFSQTQLKESIVFLKVLGHVTNLNEWSEPKDRFKNIMELKNRIESHII